MNDVVGAYSKDVTYWKALSSGRHSLYETAVVGSVGHLDTFTSLHTLCNVTSA